jgi:rhodanese-related sulfurtransferase
LIANGYKDIAALDGGFEAWGKAGYPVEVPETAGDKGESRETADPFTMVSIVEFQTMMENKDFFLVNVHVPVEGNIPGTDANIPFDEIPANLNLFPSEKDAKIVLYCKSNSMALSAAEELASLGFTNLYNVDGGTVAWQEAGLDLE